MLEFEVSKEQGGQYYAHPAGHPETPLKGTFGDKKTALKMAAKRCGMTLKEYICARKQSEVTCGEKKA